MLAVVCAGPVLVAALLWGASTATWYRVQVPDAAAVGRSDVAFDGASVVPSLTGLALLALAGVAGIVATGGALRRVVGLLLAVAGAGVAATAVWALVNPPFATDASLPVPPPGIVVGALRDQPTDTTPAPLLAVAGGLLLLAVGLTVVLREPRLPRLGARYANPSSRRADPDPDRAAWQALDAGEDPTADAHGGRGDDPGGGPRERRG